MVKAQGLVPHSLKLVEWMESFPSTAAAEPVPSPGAGVALVCEPGQGSPFPASPEDGRRVLLSARGSH